MSTTTVSSNHEEFVILVDETGWGTARQIEKLCTLNANNLFATLPTEVLLSIAPHLTARELVPFLLTARRFYFVLNHTMLTTALATHEPVVCSAVTGQHVAQLARMLATCNIAAHIHCKKYWHLTNTYPNSCASYYRKALGDIVLGLRPRGEGVEEDSKDLEMLEMLLNHAAASTGRIDDAGQSKVAEWLLTNRKVQFARCFVQCELARVRMEAREKAKDNMEEVEEVEQAHAVVVVVVVVVVDLNDWEACKSYLMEQYGLKTHQLSGRSLTRAKAHLGMVDIGSE